MDELKRCELQMQGEFFYWDDRQGVALLVRNLVEAWYYNQDLIARELVEE